MPSAFRHQLLLLSCPDTAGWRVIGWKFLFFFLLPFPVVPREGHPRMAYAVVVKRKTGEKKTTGCRISAAASPVDQRWTVGSSLLLPCCRPGESSPGCPTTAALD